MSKNLAIIIVVVLFSSCTPTLSHFTKDVYQNTPLSEGELQQIQFYLSHDIVLSRELTGNQLKIEGGSIKMVDGKKIEEVVIKRGTPGVCLFSPKSERLAISFENGGDKRYLMFGPNPKMNNRFVILASEWKKRSGIVSYDGIKYRISSEDAVAGLLVDLKRINKVKIASRQVKGRSVK